MPLLAQYARSDGLIRGMWSASTTAQLTPQIVADDPVYGYLLTDGEDSQAIQEQYVVLGGEMVSKPVVTLTATPNPFAADDVAVCTITVVPFVPCTVVVGLTPYTLVAEDPAVLLTSDVPMVFHISLAHQAACWGAPILVEAS